MKAIATFLNESEAHIVVSMLNASGIKTMLSRDDCGGVRPSLSFLTNIKIMVDEKDVEKAQELLNGHQEDHSS